VSEFSKWTTQYEQPLVERIRDRNEDEIILTYNQVNMAIRDMAEHLLNYPASQQPAIAHGMYVALAQTLPWMAQRFLDRLKSIPATADTAHVMMESIYFMGPNDRGGRDR
jgi:hypothetical protein